MLTLKLTIVLLSVCSYVQGAPQGILTQKVRLPNLDSAHIQVQRLGPNFAYSVADSGPVHGLVHYAAVPTVQYVPIAPAGVAVPQQQAVAEKPAIDQQQALAQQQAFAQQQALAQQQAFAQQYAFAQHQAFAQQPAAGQQLFG